MSFNLSPEINLQDCISDDCTACETDCFAIEPLQVGSEVQVVAFYMSCSSFSSDMDFTWNQRQVMYQIIRIDS